MDSPGCFDDHSLAVNGGITVRHREAGFRAGMRINLNNALRLLLLSLSASAAPGDDKALYESACAACHGADGSGREENAELSVSLLAETSAATN